MAKHAAMECAKCDTELVTEADSFQFDSLTSERSHVSQLHGSLISKQLPHSLDKTELSIEACDEFLVSFRGRCGGQEIPSPAVPKTKDSQLVRTSSGVPISVFVALGKFLLTNDVEEGWP